MSKQLETRVPYLPVDEIIDEMLRLASATTDRREALEWHYKAKTLAAVDMLADSMMHIRGMMAAKRGGKEKK